MTHKAIVTIVMPGERMRYSSFAVEEDPSEAVGVAAQRVLAEMEAQEAPAPEPVPEPAEASEGAPAEPETTAAVEGDDAPEDEDAALREA